MYFFHQRYAKDNEKKLKYIGLIENKCLGMKIKKELPEQT